MPKSRTSGGCDRRYRHNGLSDRHQKVISAFHGSEEYTLKIAVDNTYLNTLREIAEADDGKQEAEARIRGRWGHQPHAIAHGLFVAEIALKLELGPMFGLELIEVDVRPRSRLMSLIWTDVRPQARI